MPSLFTKGPVEGADGYCTTGSNAGSWHRIYGLFAISIHVDSLAGYFLFVHQRVDQDYQPFWRSLLNLFVRYWVFLGILMSDDDSFQIGRIRSLGDKKRPYFPCWKVMVYLTILNANFDGSSRMYNESRPG